MKSLTSDESKEAELKLLMIMVFEDKLKKYYADFVDVLKVSNHVLHYDRKVKLLCNSLMSSQIIL